MCGLSGIAGTIEPRHDPAFKDLLYMMSLRGQDSTGVGAVPKWHGDPTYLKVLGGAWELLDHKSFDKLMRGFFKLLLGHNRSTTIGGTTLKNAHPFMHSGAYSQCILGMHNGTVDSSSKARMKDGNTFGTDSEAIIANIAHEGPEKTIPKLEGAYTLVWYNDDDGTLNMIRNEKRPLVFTLSKDNKTLFFGSEVSLTRAALNRNGIETGDMYNLPENVLHSWVIPDAEKEFTAPKETKLEGYKPPVFQHVMSPVNQRNSAFEIRMADINSPSSARQIKSVFTGGSGTSTNPTMASGKTSTELSRKKSMFKGIATAGEFKNMYFYGDVNGFRVYFDKENRRWIQCKWDSKKGEYDKTYFTTAPGYLPYTEMDINACHSFRHVGKKKKKQIYFYGWLQKLLTRSDAELFFSFGCSGCQRVPQWGNEVTWLNNDHDFLCEYCSLDTALVKSWKEAAA